MALLEGACEAPVSYKTYMELLGRIEQIERILNINQVEDLPIIEPQFEHKDY